MIKSIIRIAKLANRQRQLHSIARQYYQRLYKIFMYSSLALAPLSGGSSTIGLISSSGGTIFSAISAICGIASGITITILKNGQYEQLAQSHALAINKYAVLINDIISQLSLPVEERGDPKKYIRLISDIYHATLEAAPIVESGMEGEFDSAYLLEIEKTNSGRKNEPDIKEDELPTEKAIMIESSEDSEKSHKSDDTMETLSSIELQIRDTKDNSNRHFNMKNFFLKTQKTRMNLHSD